ncbi:MAG: hypothetical protein APR54_01535 [Candidatus Cloacimonas sp. SDB]|nr:MAG: hypothetical protein APR54_01535 [Candidatus Cloacimonas sp. SDB]
MKRHLNYTRRQRIPAKNIHITFHRENEVIKSFDATINLQGLKLPFDAKVFVEVYYRTDRKRFDFGTVSNIIQPESTNISELGNLDNLNFRIKVVDLSTKYGLILAEADGIKPHTEKGDEKRIRSILSTEFNCDLGNQVWRMNYSTSLPILELNKNIPNIRSLAKSNPLFFFFVYPQVIREVLTYMFLVEEFDPEETTEEWQFNWFEFAKRIYLEDPPTRFNINDPDSRQEIVEWIEKVVDEFSSGEDKKWESFSKLVEEVSVK